MLEDMRRIDVIKSFILEGQRLNGAENEGASESLDWLASFRVIFRQEIKQMGCVRMRSVTGPDVQECFCRRCSKPPADVEFSENPDIAHSHTTELQSEKRGDHVEGQRALTGKRPGSFPFPFCHPLNPLCNTAR